jgi:hypothetical protein
MQLSTLFQSDKSLAVHTTDKGRVTFQSQKDYGIANNLKGQALKRAHHAYKLSFGLAGNQKLSSEMAGGKIIVRSVTPTASGFNASFYFVDKMNAPKASADDKADKAADAAIAALVKTGMTIDQAKAAFREAMAVKA